MTALGTLQMHLIIHLSLIFSSVPCLPFSQSLLCAEMQCEEEEFFP